MVRLSLENIFNFYTIFISGVAQWLTQRRYVSKNVETEINPYWSLVQRTQRGIIKRRPLSRA